jgi:Concanavalin A-like lectin/glucanases superfamily
MARSFPGTTADYLSVGNPAALDITGDQLTIHAFLKPSVVGGIDHTIVSKWDQGGQFQYSTHIASSGVLFFDIGDAGGGDFLSGTTVLKAGVWYSSCWRKNGTTGGSQQVYLNGRLDGEGTSGRTMISRTASVNIGRLTNAAQPFNGSIAHAAIWNAALTQQEIELLSRGVNPLKIRPGNLRGYWPLEGYGGAGGVGGAKDLSAYANHATLNGAVTSAPGPDLPFVEQYPLLSSLKFPGIPSTMDAATVKLRFTPSGTDEHIPFCLIIGEGEAMLRWTAADDTLRWLAGDADLRWQTEFRLGTGHC